MEALRTGSTYMKPLSYFQQLEDEALRGDPLEGANEIMQPDYIGQMTLRHAGGDIVFNPEEIVGPVVFRPSPGMHRNVFCMYSITKPTDLFPIDDRVLEFGDSFVMALKSMEFIRRFGAAAERAGYRGTASAVKYFDGSTYSGVTGAFRKSSEYAWQNEYRFLIEPGSSDPITLQLGDLRDIMTEVMPTEELRERLRFDAAAAVKAGLCW
jgi:hypothetical protein